MTNVKTCVDDLNNGLPSIELLERRNSKELRNLIKHFLYLQAKRSYWLPYLT